MKSFVVGSAMAAAVAGAVSLEQCYEVSFSDRTYHADSDVTVFDYTVTTLSPDCPEVTRFSLMGNCPGECPDPAALDSMTSTWAWKSPLIRESTKISVHVPGEVTQLTLGNWTLETSQGNLQNQIQAPFCLDDPTDPQADCVVEFDDNEITLSPGGSQTIRVSLSGDPLGSATVELESNCNFLSACTLEFTSDDFSIEQEVVVTNDPSNPAAVCTVRATTLGAICAPGELTVLVQPAANDRYAMIYADPQIKTFPSTRFGFPYYGVHTLSRDLPGEFSMQSFTGPCSIAGRCTWGIAIQMRSFMAKVNMSEDGTIDIQYSGNPAESGVVILSEPQLLRLHLNVNLRVNVRSQKAGNANQYSILATLSASSIYRGQLRGIFGSNTEPGLDLINPSNSLSPTTNIHCRSWATPAEEDLFASFPNPVTIAPLNGSEPFSPSDYGYTCTSP